MEQPQVLTNSFLQKMWDMEEGCVYFIQGKLTGLVKIGYTKDNPNKRLSQLQVGSPDKLILLGTFRGGPVSEAAEQAKWSDLHEHGEWFRGEQQLLDYIQYEINR